ncbi:hypothetical protein FOE78_05045 [Microlunatus elymi]|uniref:Beta-galactosidase trimerisation domain-containing protein n=1 Tax=Microlunatus elymi TaxID=2596828 RepID=A0A516PW49_9ACTN|nr:hypothetical protein [Microlunatus elymi]QDP95362.1 hypothetical protein FOE78_05045 [Microlunatus elymi]
MERGVYFDGWFPRQHCYHPSLPPRRLTMVEDLAAYRATMLVWSALGGGVVSLPYLEDEAHGAIPARFRFYGFLNDAEFIQECRKRGITVFGVVFEHAWEFPVELNDDESVVLSLNETRGAGKADWLGLREFWQNRYPKLWPTFESYFPDGIRSTDGQPVTDPLEECAQRNIHGDPLHALWIEVPGSEHYNIMMERNNPVWREYLKGVIRTQIDAGVQGIQFDEAETPITSLQYGGCFCHTCMSGFREFLQQAPSRPAELDRADLETFHYGEWLLARGYDFTTNREQTPLFDSYMRFQRQNIVRYFGELADYARSYAASKNRDIKITGNFFNLFEHYYPMREKVDVIVTEMRNTTYRQPAWYRHAAAFAGEKPLVVVENPYGGVVPDLLNALRSGREFDRFRLSIYEAAALGVNMSLPYGSWMGSEIEDAFYAPHELCLEAGNFLADHEDLFAPATYSRLAVVFSAGSAFRRIAPPDLMGDTGDNRVNRQVADRGPFWSVAEALSDAGHVYDVVYFPDDELGTDHVTATALEQYTTIVLPGCTYLTDRQAVAVQAALERGARVIATAEVCADRPEIANHPAYDHMAGAADLTRVLEPQIAADGLGDTAYNIVQLPGGDAAIHLIRYDYDPVTDAVPVIEKARIEVTLPQGFQRVAAVSPHGDFEATLEAVEGERYRLLVGQVPLYGIIRMSR